MKSLMLLLAAILISSYALSQSSPDTLGNIYDDLLKKKEGILYLKDGRKISGFIDYSTFTNILRVESKESLPKPLTALNVARLEYFDESSQHQRVFVAREFGFPRYGVDTSVGFFEILKSGSDIQLVSRSLPIHLLQKKGSPNTAHGRYGNRAVYGTTDTNYRQKLVTFTDQIEVIGFILNDKILPYFVIKTREVENNSGHGLRNNSSRKHVKVVDKSLPERVMGDKYKLVRHYASSKNLSWNDKDELALIVEHYLSLK